MPRPRRVAIVGGGIAGLTLAAALPSCVEVTLHEAQPERATGAALGLWPAAVRALGRVGVDLPPPAPPGRAGLFGVDGRRRLHLATPALTLLERPDLMAALEAAVPARVTRVHQEVEDPTALDADLVVGADGVRSQVRGLVQRADRVATPWVALRGLAGPADPAEVGEYWGPDRLFGLVPLDARRSYWFTTHRSDLGPEPLEVPEVLAQARTRFGGDCATIRRHLETADDRILATRIWTVPALRRYARERYVVVGDAAHASTPNLGRGATDAVLDATSLAATLTGHGSLLRWQAARLPATRASALGAAALMRLATRPRTRPRPAREGG
ncbi:hypothetical protein BJF80_13555 [Serinicoccus sp. CUA-874]|uniref:FAD-dependent monooxygenase n=1 Tax=Serinicoccus sp. CUA-874 TaxID=1517939 RepID=UPI000961CC1A|nr:NAD(P)/FAD-dependent oxidoreductase [Serinicoccus sp. CUA-874]OLT19059.1 hypothetical protein BJF80_13555 [Serinicoccus sp. CUA-874]